MVMRRPLYVEKLMNQHMFASHQQVEFVQPMNIIIIIIINLLITIPEYPLIMLIPIP